MKQAPPLAAPRFLGTLRFADRVRECVVSELHDILYYLNEDDEIVTVNSAWNRFARANNGNSVEGHCVQWWPIWVFISDPSTVLIYRHLIARAREGRPVGFGIRCDGPTVVRLARMEIRRMRSGLLEFRVHPVSETPRRRVPLMAVNESLAGDTKLCGWCMSIRIAAGLWLPAEQAHSSTCGGDPDRELLVSHGSCPRCVDRMLALGRAEEPDMGALSRREGLDRAVKTAS